MLSKKQAVQDVTECYQTLSELMQMLRATAPGLLETGAIGELTTLLDLYLSAVDGNLDMLQYASKAITHHLSENSTIPFE